MEAFVSGNMQVPGHVQLHQVTSHRQLLKHFASLALSCHHRQHPRSETSHNTIACCQASALGHQRTSRSSTTYHSNCNCSLSRNNNSRHHQRPVTIHAAAAGLVGVIISEESSTTMADIQQSPHNLGVPAVTNSGQSNSRVMNILANRLQAQALSKTGDATSANPVPTQQQLQQSAVFDPSALPIADRVKLLRNRIAARSIRRSPPSFRTGSKEAGVSVLSICSAAGVTGPAATYIMNHVLAARITGQTDVLSEFVANYKRLADAYGSTAALQWLRRVPSIIRNAEEVPGRLAQLKYLLGRGPLRLAELSEVLEVTRRCPQVLGVDAALMVPRAKVICDLLGKPQDAACDIIRAAPALLGMSCSKLESKVKQLRALAAANPYWAAAYGKSTTGSLAVLLTYSLQRYSRLQYMKERQPYERLCISTVMALAEKTMAEKFPDYPEWKQQQQQQQQQQPGAAIAGQHQRPQQAEHSSAADVARQQQQEEAREVRAMLMKQKCDQDSTVDVAVNLPTAQFICELLGRSHDEAYEVITAAPALLGVEHSRLESKAQQLRLLAAANPYWAAAYDRSSTGTLAAQLTYSSKRYSRLQYMLERQPNSRLSISSVMGLSKKMMAEKFPDYADWQLQQQQQQLLQLQL